MPPRIAVVAAGLFAIAAVVLLPCESQASDQFDEGYRLSITDGDSAIGWVRIGSLVTEHGSESVINDPPTDAGETDAGETDAGETDDGETDDGKTGKTKTTEKSDAKPAPRPVNGKPEAIRAENEETAKGAKQDAKPSQKETLADKFRQMLADREREGNSVTAKQGTAKPKSPSPRISPAAKPKTTPAAKPKTDNTAEATDADQQNAPKNAPKKPTVDPPEIATKKPSTPPQPPETQEEPSSEPKPPTSDPADPKAAPPKVESEEEIGEGPELFAEKFAQILAELRKREATTETAEKTPPPIEVKEPVAVVPKQVAKPSTAEVSQEPTISVLVLRNSGKLADIEPSERIGQLILTGQQITNRSLKNLAGLTVSSLSIEAINISNSGLQYAKEVRGIRMLRLWSPGIDDGALRLVAEFSDLEVLDIEGTAIGGAEFAELKSLTKLESMTLGPQVSDTTIAHLQHLPALRQLDLRACGKLTLACLTPLANLKDLEVIWLPRHLRTKGKRALRLTLPECQVHS